MSYKLAPFLGAPTFPLIFNVERRSLLFVKQKLSYGERYEQRLSTSRWQERRFFGDCSQLAMLDKRV